eukprot:5937114-Pyramimonas_sp.AAC.3
MCAKHKTCVVFRNVHATEQFVLTGLAHWVSWGIRTKFSELRCEGSREAALRLTPRPFSHSAAFLILDVRYCHEWMYGVFG